MTITGGFGMQFHVATGAVRSWYVAADGAKRWVHNDHQVIEPTPLTREQEAAEANTRG